ncbi:MAG: AmmeMemoRadiSam system protein B [Candidatus Micrarchaeaceae archaeon]
MPIRKSMFAGEFYSDDPKILRAFLSKALAEANVEGDVLKTACAYVAPHAGYEYSGRTAAYAYKALGQNRLLNDISTLVFIGPNHTGIGTPISVSSADWETPLGVVKNDLELSNAIVEASSIAEFDETAHAGEHSIEVQLPFIQYMGLEKRAVFICMGDQGIDASNDLANAILKASEALGRKIAVMASSDFNHYESKRIGERKDRALFEKIELLDYKAFNPLVESINSSACGYGPITVAMEYAKGAGCKKGVLLNYSNSGIVTGDFGSVVDYAAFAMV